MFFILVIALAGCNKLKGPAAGQSNIVVAQDKSCQVILPSGWHERNKDGAPVLRAGGPGETALFTVVRIPKEDLADNVTLQNEGQSYIDELRKKPLYEKITLTSGPVDRTIRSRPALQYELDGVMKEGKTKFHYVITVVEGQRSFFRLIGTLVPSAMAKYRSDVDEVTKSFAELP